MPLDKDVNLNEIAKESEGYTGADIEALSREAAMLSLRENIENKSVGRKHFNSAMEKVRPSVSKGDVERYKRIEAEYLRSAKAALEGGSSYLG